MTLHLSIVPAAHRLEVSRRQTLLDAALDAGFWLPHRCRSGSCGSCKCRVLSGQVDHGESMESVLPPAERAAGWILPCCARARTDLVLECADAEAPGEIRVKRLAVRVAERTPLATGIMRLRLALPENKRFWFVPGQSVDILLDETRRVSCVLAGVPGSAAGIELHVEVSPASWLPELCPGRILRLEGPHGDFHQRRDAEGSQWESGR